MQRNTVFFVCCYSLQSYRYLRKIFFNFNDEVCVWIVVFFLVPFCLVLFCFFSVFISVIESLKTFFCLEARKFAYRLQIAKRS